MFDCSHNEELSSQLKLEFAVKASQISADQMYDMLTSSRPYFVDRTSFVVWFQSQMIKSFSAGMDFGSKKVTELTTNG